MPDGTDLNLTFCPTLKFMVSITYRCFKIIVRMAQAIQTHPNHFRSSLPQKQTFAMMMKDQNGRSRGFIGRVPIGAALGGFLVFDFGRPDHHQREIEGGTVLPSNLAIAMRFLNGRLELIFRS